MKKNIKKIGLITILVLGLFTITSCKATDELSEEEKADAKKETIFKIERQEEKLIELTVQNGKKDSIIFGTIKVDEGDELFDDYSFHGTKVLFVELYEKGTKGEKEPLFTEDISGEGRGITSDIPSGEYEVYFTVKDKTLTGTYKIEAKKRQE